LPYIIRSIRGLLQSLTSIKVDFEEYIKKHYYLGYLFFDSNEGVTDVALGDLGSTLKQLKFLRKVDLNFSG